MTSEYTQQVAQIAGPLEAAMDAMAGTLSANQEVVLHNLTTPEHSIIKIINGHVSGRGNGDHLLAGPEKIPVLRCCCRRRITTSREP